MPLVSSLFLSGSDPAADDEGTRSFVQFLGMIQRSQPHPLSIAMLCARSSNSFPDHSSRVKAPVAILLNSDYCFVSPEG